LLSQIESGPAGVINELIVDWAIVVERGVEILQLKTLQA
jgi:hypothetical protein